MWPPAESPPMDTLSGLMLNFTAFARNWKHESADVCTGHDGGPYECHCLPAIVDSSWEDVLWSHAIVNVDDLDANLITYTPAPGCLGFETSKDPATCHVSVCELHEATQGEKAHHHAN